jgi:hypothetical protein
MEQSKSKYFVVVAICLVIGLSLPTADCDENSKVVRISNVEEFEEKVVRNQKIGNG